MLVVKAIGVGVAAGIAAMVLYLVLVVMVPVAVAAFRNSANDGGGIMGFSISIELGLLVAVVGFVAGFGWTLLQAWANQWNQER